MTRPADDIDVELHARFALPVGKRPPVSTRNDRVRVRKFGESGLRFAYRENTMDERAVQSPGEWLDQPAPSSYELRVDGVILDVGTHISGFIQLAACLVPKRRIMAMEACRGTYEMLVRSNGLNELRNVEASHFALSDRAGKTRLHYSEVGNWSPTITRAPGPKGELVRSETLVDYLRRNGIDSFDLAKFNCEGAEFPILMSTRAEALCTIRQMLIFYHADLFGSPYGLERLEGHLGEAGFELERRKSTSPRGHIVAGLVG